MLNYNQENSFVQTNTISKPPYNNYKIPLKFKGYILISLIQKQKKKQIEYLKQIFFYWYVNRSSSSQPYKKVLFTMLTKKMSPFAFFYKIKSYASKSLQSSHIKKNKQNLIFQSQHQVQKNLKKKDSCIDIDIGNEKLVQLPTIYQKTNRKGSNHQIIHQKKCVFAQQVSQIINLDKKQHNKQKQTDQINYFHKNKSKKNHLALTQYFESLKNIFSTKLEKKQELKSKKGCKGDYKKKQIKTEGQQQQQFSSQLQLQLNTSQISSFQGSKKSISFCPSFCFCSSFKSLIINQGKQDQKHLNSQRFIQRGFQIGTKVGITLLKSVISSIFSKQKHFFITNLLKYQTKTKTSQQNYKLKISQPAFSFNNNNTQIQSYSSSNSTSTISLLNQDQYDQRMDLIKRNLQLLEIEQQKQKEIFILCEELQIHHEELLQIQEQFNKIQMNLKHNFFINLDRIFKKIKKEVFVQIRLHNQKLTVFSTLKQLLQEDSDPFDQFPRNINNNNQESEQSLDTRNQLNSLQQQKANNIPSIKVGIKMSQTLSHSSKLSSQAQQTSNRQIGKYHHNHNLRLTHLKRPSININIIGTQRQLHRVYTISSMNSQSSQSSLPMTMSQNEYSSNLLFQESIKYIKQLNQIQEMNNESDLFSNNSKVSENE